MLGVSFSPYDAGLARVVSWSGDPGACFHVEHVIPTRFSPSKDVEPVDVG